MNLSELSDEDFDLLMQFRELPEAVKPIVLDALKRLRNDEDGETVCRRAMEQAATVRKSAA